MVCCNNGYNHHFCGVPITSWSFSRCLLVSLQTNMLVINMQGQMANSNNDENHQHVNQQTTHTFRTNDQHQSWTLDKLSHSTWLINRNPNGGSLWKFSENITTKWFDCVPSDDGVCRKSKTDAGHCCGT